MKFWIELAVIGGIAAAVLYFVWPWIDYIILLTQIGGGGPPK